MRKYLTIVMLSILLAPFMARMFYTTFFYFNQSSIARELCVNRNVANNTCQGTCFLKKKLKQLDHSNTSSEQSKSMEKMEEKVLFTDYLFTSYKFTKASSTEVIFQEYSSPFISSIVLNDIFHPPLN
jgi:hypothetical protein